MQPGKPATGKKSLPELIGTKMLSQFAGSDEREATCVEVETFPF